MYSSSEGSYVFDVVVVVYHLTILVSGHGLLKKC